MLRFTQFILEESYDPWKDIQHHDENAPEHIANHLDNWVGSSHRDIKQGQTFGYMIPRGAEENHEEIHNQGSPIRDALRRKYGDYITVYRGSIGEPSTTARSRVFTSWTTDPKVAERFAGVTNRQKARVFSDEEIKNHEDELEQTGTTNTGQHILKKNENGDIDLYSSSGEHITDVESVRDHLNDHNEYAVNYNREIDKQNKDAKKRVKKKTIPVDRVSWATNRAGQKELLVRANKFQK